MSTKGMNGTNSPTINTILYLQAHPGGEWPLALFRAVYQCEPIGARHPLSPLYSCIRRYNLGYVASAPPGSIELRGSKYYWCAPDKLLMTLTVPKSMLVEGSIVMCMVRDGRLVAKEVAVA